MIYDNIMTCNRNGKVSRKEFGGEDCTKRGLWKQIIQPMDHDEGLAEGFACTGTVWAGLEPVFTASL